MKEIVELARKEYPNNCEFNIKLLINLEPLL